jgi:hypothetical protein
MDVGQLEGEFFFRVSGFGVMKALIAKEVKKRK